MRSNSMSEAYSATGQTAKSGPRENRYEISEIDTFPTIHEMITALFERVQPKKTWALIAKTLGLKEHTAKHRAANHTSYSIEELQMILHGDNGREALDLLMKTAAPVPQWWRDWCDTWELTAIRCEQALLQQRALRLDNTTMDLPSRRKLKRFVDADRNLSATRAEKETVLGILHQDRNRAVAGAVVATAGQAQAGRSAGARR
jgi:hypothetical protein